MLYEFGIKTLITSKLNNIKKENKIKKYFKIKIDDHTITQHQQMSI